MTTTNVYQDMMTLDQEKAEKALRDFVSTVNSTGGVVKQPDGLYAPSADQDWIDLGEAYLKACEALGMEPQTVSEEEIDLLEDVK